MGAGRVGLELARILTDGGGFDVALADISEAAQDRAHARGFAVVGGESFYRGDIERMLAGADAVVAAVPAAQCPDIAGAAAALGLHYLDFTGGSSYSAGIADVGRGSPKSFIVGCGLSPGIITPMLLDALSRNPWATDAEVSIGILPAEPRGRLSYGQIWDVAGLIDEYTLPGTALDDGRIEPVAALGGYRRLDIGGRAFESFLTGATGGELCAHLQGRLRSLAFRTLRLPGHHDYIGFLLDDLGLRQKRYLVVSLLREALPPVEADEVITMISLSQDGAQPEREHRILYRLRAVTGPGGEIRFAGQQIAAAHAAAILDLLRTGRLVASGLVPQEAIPPQAVLQNRFLTWLHEPAAQSFEGKDE
jgi:saccharopine dehydrogenase-like NADP-dependent oxidoreductase